MKIQTLPILPGSAAGAAALKYIYIYMLDPESLHGMIEGISLLSLRSQRSAPDTLG